VVNFNECRLFVLSGLIECTASRQRIVTGVYGTPRLVSTIDDDKEDKNEGKDAVSTLGSINASS
jgi:hypothetical protein